MDEIESLLNEQSKPSSPFDKPLIFLIVPDRIAKFNVEDRILELGKIRNRTSIRLLTINEIANIVLEEIEGASKPVIEREIRRNLIYSSICKMTEGSEPNKIAERLCETISISQSPENDNALERIDDELEDFLRCVITTDTRISSSKEMASLREIAKNLKTEFEVETVSSALDFYERLMESIDGLMAGAEIEGFFSRNHLITAATTLLKKKPDKFVKAFPTSNIKIWISGIPVIDRTVMSFILQLAATPYPVRINIDQGSTERFIHRLKSAVPGYNVEFQPDRTNPDSRDISNARAIEVPDMRREVRRVAGLISEYLQKGFLPKDILVIARDVRGYLPFIEEIMRNFGIPSYIQTRRYLVHTPAYRHALSLLDLLAGIEKEQDISAKMVSDPFRLGFTRFGKEEMQDEKQFLHIETQVAIISHGKSLKWEEWDEKIERSHSSPLKSLVKWINFVFADPKIGPIMDSLSRFQRSCSGWDLSLRPDNGFLYDRFEICTPHITAKIGQLYGQIDRLSEYEIVRKELYGKNKLLWSDIRSGFINVAGSEDYGLPFRDASAVRFIDAGNTYFQNAKIRIILGLTSEVFPRKCPTPFLILENFRRAVNEKKNILYLRDPETDYENEIAFFNASKGQPSLKEDIILTMPYLDERGHKEEWSIFVDPDRPEKIGASEIIDESTTSFSPTEYWKHGAIAIRGTKRGMYGTFEKVMINHWKDLFKMKFYSRYQSLETRILNNDGPGTIDPKKETYLGTFLASIMNDPIPSHELDLYMTCPMMYYFYRYIYSLGPFLQKDPCGSRTYVSEWKYDFYLEGLTPFPIRRTTISTEMASTLAEILTRYPTVYDLTSNQKSISDQIFSNRRLDLCGKNHLLNTVSYLRMNASSPGKIIAEAGRQSTSDPDIWRPLLIKFNSLNRSNQSYCMQIHFAKLKKQSRGLKKCALENRFGKRVICPRINGRSDEYEDIEVAQYIWLKNGIKKMKYSPRDEDWCDVCEYSTLCGRWGFN